jgi:hypothetical protein
MMRRIRCFKKCEEGLVANAKRKEEAKTADASHNVKGFVNGSGRNRKSFPQRTEVIIERVRATKRPICDRPTPQEAADPE